MTGLRLSELVDAKIGRLYSRPRKDGLGVRWMLKVLGKGQKWRAIPLPTAIIAALKEYLVSRGLPENFSEIPPDCPIIGNLKAPLEAARQSTLYKSIKQFFSAAAHHLERTGHSEDSRLILNASTHWLRHTCGSHLAQTLPINMVQQLLGHASLSTTTIYTSTDEEALYEAIEAEFST
jgi:site-specific recombinase XerD